MITRLSFRNFKRFTEASFELGDNVVLIGPNNSGKTTALQALALWDIGYRQWLDKHGAQPSSEQRVGVAINRRDLVAIPAPNANLLWHDLHVRRRSGDGTQNIRVDILVEGVSQGEPWKCGLEFDYANEESFYCRPLRLGEDKHAERMPVPPLAGRMSVAFIPPMSGLADREYLKQWGEIGVLLGQGQTAQVLRNLCYRIYTDDVLRKKWPEIASYIRELFGVELLEPEFREATAEITMRYRERSGRGFDLSSSGRGLQQTLLLLSHLYANPRSILLLDEPDAHLEILRQRQIYNLLSDVSSAQDSQIIAASHSEVVLNEAATRGQVVAFVGKPHSLADRGSQLVKALKDIGFEDYYQAEQTGWVLYVEEATDLAILREFAKLLNHDARPLLEAPFAHYLGTNQPQRARSHFHGLREAKPDLVGFALFDRIEDPLRDEGGMTERMWSRREIENYFTSYNVLMGFAQSKASDDLFGFAESEKREEAMEASIDEVTNALATLGKPGPWSDEVKASDEVLAPIFQRFSERAGTPLALRKRQFHTLVRLMEPSEVDEEVRAMLDGIVAVSGTARPEG